MAVTAIIQARMGSSRLPDKVLADIAGRPMLTRVVERTALATSVGQVVVATTDRERDDAIVGLCAQLNVHVFRGSEHDVLKRYADAAADVGAQTIARITADCPLIDPAIVDLVVDAFGVGEVAYASNTLERTYPRGLDVEVFSRDALDTAAREATGEHERAHVTPFMYQHPQRFRVRSVRHEADQSRHRWTVDTSEDLRLTREIYAALGADSAFGFADVLALVERRPEVAEIYAHVEQKGLHES